MTDDDTERETNLMFFHAGAAMQIGAVIVALIGVALVYAAWPAAAERVASLLRF